jgi:hypothetical protein
MTTASRLGERYQGLGVVITESAANPPDLG